MAFQGHQVPTIVDWPAWLAADEAPRTRVFAVYRDAEVLLPRLEGSLFDCLEVCAAAGQCFLHVRRESFHTIPHSDCVVEPALLDPVSWNLDEMRGSITVFNCAALSPPGPCPAPINTFAKLEPGLGCLWLYFDLIRGLVFLWSKRCPALLCTSNTCNPCAQALRQVAPLCWHSHGLFMDWELQRGSLFLLFHLLIVACS